MPRDVKILDGFNAMTEEFGRALGDAEDWLDRVEPMLYDLISDLVQGRIDPAAARVKVWQEFSGARADLMVSRKQRLTDAFEFKYKHLPAESMPFVRVMAELPRDNDVA